MTQSNRYIRTWLSPPGDIIGVQDIILPDVDCIARLLDNPNIETVQLRSDDGQTFTYTKAEQ